MSKNEIIEFDDLDLPPPPPPATKEDSSEDLKVPWAAIIISAFFIIFFTLLFFCSFFIPRSKYIKAKEEHPDLDFYDISTTPLALYWTYYCVLLIFFVVLPLFLYYCNLLLVEIFTFTCLAVFIFGILSPIYIRLDEVVDNALSNSYDYSSYEDDINEMINGLPYLEIGYTGVSKTKTGKRTFYYYCNPPTVVNYSTNATTSYYLPEFGDYAWVQVELNATFSPEVLEYFNKYREIYRLALPENDQNGRKITWTDISGYKMKTYNPNPIFVKKKELSGQLNPDVGKTMIAFWAGFGYVYELLSIPIYRPVITKSNIEINLSVDDVPKEGAYFYEILSLTHCTS